MRSKIQPVWQDRRSAFNHDWLKNQFIPALETAHNILHGRISVEGYMAEFLAHDLPRWEAKQGDVFGLISDFEAEMSPRKLFHVPPLCYTEPDASDWMKDVVHELWLARFPVNDWVAAALNAVTAVDLAYEELTVLVGEDAMAWTKPDFLQKFAEFRAACHDLAKAVEQFPNDIIVI